MAKTAERAAIPRLIRHPLECGGKGRSALIRSEMTGAHTDLHHPVHRNQRYHAQQGKSLGVSDFCPMLPPRTLTSRRPDHTVDGSG